MTWRYLKHRLDREVDSIDADLRPHSFTLYWFSFNLYFCLILTLLNVFFTLFLRSYKLSWLWCQECQYRFSFLRSLRSVCSSGNSLIYKLILSLQPR